VVNIDNINSISSLYFNITNNIGLNNKSNVFILNNKEYDLDSKFAYYLVGLIEGDGSIITPDINTLRYPVIKIVFAEKDLSLAKKINSYLIYGRLYKEEGKYYTLIFYRLDVILLIINLINGKMRTPKINALYKLIDWFNLSKKIKIKKLGIDSNELDNNPWLSGLLDADGSFIVSYSLNKKNIINALWCYMKISQKQSYTYYCLNGDIKDNKIIDNNLNENNSYIDIIKKIQTYLKVNNVRIINRERKSYTELGYEVRTAKIESNYILINYLKDYPLFSSKHLDFLDWKALF
jgi:LAGLIDADG endonuclease